MMHHSGNRKHLILSALMTVIFLVNTFMVFGVIQKPCENVYAEENDFSDEFLKRVERNRKSVFIIGETQGAVDEFTQELREEYPKLVLAGAAATENCVGDLEGVINEMNAATPDVIISIIPSPGQEHFLVEHRDKINANLWYGIGGFEVHRKRSRIKGFFWNLIHRVRLKNSIEKYES